MLTRKQLLRYEEEQDPAKFRIRYANNAAVPSTQLSLAQSDEKDTPSCNSPKVSSTQLDRTARSSRDGIDAEKAKDEHLVDWYGPDDPGERLAGSLSVARNVDERIIQPTR